MSVVVGVERRVIFCENCTREPNGEFFLCSKSGKLIAASETLFLNIKEAT